MKRLRHPIRAIREPFGTAGLILASIALIAALTGGAYAASKGLTPQQKKEVKKIAKSFQGTGPQGAAGAAGPAGPQGAKGDNGAPGSNGTNGTNGVNVTSEEFSGTKDGKCAGRGGSKFVAASGSTYACNGEKGEPWTAGGTLPSEATETGSWAFTNFVSPPEEFGTAFVPISFTIPLEAELGEDDVHEAPDPACPGTAANPTAEPGNLCIYQSLKEEEGDKNTLFPLVIHKAASASYDVGASTAGAFLRVEYEGQVATAGTWAVTAE